MKRLVVRNKNRSGFIQGQTALWAMAIAISAVVGQAKAETLPGGDQVTASSPQIAWRTNLRLAWTEAAKRNVPMVIFITSDRCHFCDVMKRDTWSDDGVSQLVAGRYLAIELKPGRNAEALSQMEVPAYPTTLVATHDGKIVAHRVGYQSAMEMRSLLAEAEASQRR